MKIQRKWYYRSYMGLQRVAKKWTQPIRDWKAALNQFVILYGERVPM
jgi:transposase-like protein